jgi:hypothetical protein
MILQEYLAKLGFSIDEPSMKKFVGALAMTGAKTAELGSLALETAGAIELMVTRVARKYETLYYVSQRTSQSVKYIQGTQFAFKQIGLSAEDANHSIENMAATLRTQPWLKSLFGGASTPQDVANRLGKSGLPYFLQARFAEMIGLDEKTLLQLQKYSNVEAAARAEMARRQKEAGVNPDQLAEQTAAFGREINKLESTLGVFGDKMATNFLNPISDSVKRMTSLVEWLTRVDTATKGWTGALIALGGTAGGLFVLEKIMRRLLGLSAATAVGSAAGGALAKAGGAGRFAGLSTLARGGLFAALAGLLVVKQNDPATKKKLQEQLGPLLYELGLSKSADLTGAAPGESTPTKEGKDRAQQAVDFFKGKGYPTDSAIGIASGLHSESGLDPKARNKQSGMRGIGQWDTKRRAKFRELFLKNVEDATLEEQLQFVAWELDNTERATGNALRAGGLGGRGAAHKFITGFERPGLAGTISDMSRAGPMADMLSRLASQQSGDNSKTNNITLNSKTDVHLGAGGGDVASTAREYMKAHNDVNDTLVRNVVGAVR